MGKLPFEGVRVADFGWILAAPLAGQWLATLGADVIRIESKARPDLVRSGAVGGVIPGPDPSWNRVATFNSVNYKQTRLYAGHDQAKGAGASLPHNREIGCRKRSLHHSGRGALRPDVRQAEVHQAGYHSHRQLLSRQDRPPGGCGGNGSGEPGLRRPAFHDGVRRRHTYRNGWHMARLHCRPDPCLPDNYRPVSPAAHRRGTLYRPLHGRDGDEHDPRPASGLLHEWQGRGASREQG